MSYHISYISQATIPISLLEDELSDIAEANSAETNSAEASSHNNYLKKISGCLIYRSGSFLQYQEGEKSIVCSTYKVVKADQRHNNVKTLSSGYHTKNLYNSWKSMQILSDPDETQPDETQKKETQKKENLKKEAQQKETKTLLDLINDYRNSKQNSPGYSETINANVIAVIKHYAKKIRTEEK